MGSLRTSRAIVCRFLQRCWTLFLERLAVPDIHTLATSEVLSFAWIKYLSSCSARVQLAPHKGLSERREAARRHMNVDTRVGITSLLQWKQRFVLLEPSQTTSLNVKKPRMCWPRDGVWQGLKRYASMARRPNMHVSLHYSNAAHHLDTQLILTLILRRGTCNLMLP